MKKRNLNKKQSKKVVISRRNRIAVLLAVILLAGASLVVLSASTARWIATAQSEQREDRIEGIYTSLAIPEAYRLTDSDVFGEKRIYDWDKNRTYSSSKWYLRGAPVDETVAEVDGLIKAAGFEFIDEPYAGSVFTQYHYKSKKGEYIRLTVSSKPYDDAFDNALVMDETRLADLTRTLNINAGPSNVLIKVNLDDNNE